MAGPRAVRSMRAPRAKASDRKLDAFTSDPEFHDAQRVVDGVE